MAIGIDIGGQEISAVVVRDSLDDLLGLLSDASRSVGTGTQEWVITDLRVGSAVMAVGSADEAPVAALIREGIETLQRAAEIPAGWTRRMVERVRDLGQRVGRGGVTRMHMTGLASQWAALTPEVVTNAERALGISSVSYGSFRGVVDRWNQHKKREIGLALDDGGSLTVKFPASLAERIRSKAIGEHVEVWGLVERNAADQPTGMTMEDFEVLPERARVPLSAVAGIWSDEDGRPWFELEEWLAQRGE